MQEDGWHRSEKGVLAKVKPPERKPPGQSRPTGRRDKWHHVAAVYDGRNKSLWVDGRRVRQWGWKGTVKPGTAPLRIGAIGRDGLADGFLDGDVAMPVIYKRALTEEEIRRRFEAKALQTPTGDHVLALSGNTMFWRVSFNEDGSVMESRKVDTMGNQLEPANRGEVWHSQDGQRGGMSRECGYPAWRLIGLEFITLSNTATKGHGGFRVLDSKHPLFNQPHRLDVTEGDELGLPAAGKPSMVVGHEGDARVSTIAKVTTAPPPTGAEFPSRDPDGNEWLAEGVIDWTVGTGTVFDYFMRPIPGPKAQAAGVNLGAEMIYWQWPDGGKVFNAASICAGRGFVDDPRFGQLIKNVLHHFGVPPPSGV
ncbi:MAG: LamG-like jellyroll fold domain-containing protein [Pirellulales bacterium]